MCVCVCVCVYIYIFLVFRYPYGFGSDLFEISALDFDENMMMDHH